MSVTDTGLRCENAARLYKLASFTVARFHEVRWPVFVRHERPVIVEPAPRVVYAQPPVVYPQPGIDIHLPL